MTSRSRRSFLFGSRREAPVRPQQGHLVALSALDDWPEAALDALTPRLAPGVRVDVEGGRTLARSPGQAPTTLASTPAAKELLDRCDGETTVGRIIAGQREPARARRQLVRWIQERWLVPTNEVPPILELDDRR